MKINFKNLIIYSIQYGSLSIILLALNAMNQDELVLSLSLLQSAIYIVTIGLAANLRSLSLAKQYLSSSLFKIRLYIAATAFVFMAIILYYINAKYFAFTMMLASRKLLDWIDEILILNSTDENRKIIYIIVQLGFLIGFPFIIFLNVVNTTYYLLLWNLSMIFIMKGFYLELGKHFRVSGKANKIFKIFVSTYPNILATLFPTIANYFYRVNIIEVFEIKKASNLIMSLTLSGVISSFFIFIFIPELVNNFRKHKKGIYLLIFLSFIILTYSLISFFTYKYKVELNQYNLNHKFIFFGCIAGVLTLIASSMRIFQIQLLKITSFPEETIISLIIISLIFLAPANASANYYAIVPIFGAVISIVIYDINNSFLDEKIILKKFLYTFLFIVIFLSATLFSINHDLSINPKTINFKIISLCIFLAMIFFTNVLVKKLVKISSNFSFDLLIMMLWFLFNFRFLEVSNANFFILLFFVSILVLQYLYNSICNFINIGFSRIFMRSYLIIISSYLAF
jgi:hypothetical protein